MNSFYPLQRSFGVRQGAAGIQLGQFFQCKSLSCSRWPSEKPTPAQAGNIHVFQEWEQLLALCLCHVLPPHCFSEIPALGMRGFPIPSWI